MSNGDHAIVCVNRSRLQALNLFDGMTTFNSSSLATPISLLALGSIIKDVCLSIQSYCEHYIEAVM